MIGFIVDDTYPNQRHTSVTWSGTGQSAFGHTANTMFNKKNGDQHSTNVKNTTPNTLLAFCSVLTALAAAKLWRFCLLARNLETNIDGRFFFFFITYKIKFVCCSSVLRESFTNDHFRHPLAHILKYRSLF